jgi:hypothetical protein
MKSDDVKAKLAEARKAKEERQKAREGDAEARELAILELEEKLEAEHGARGVMFEIVDTVEGPIAVKLGEAVLHTRFQQSKMTDAELDEYVRPCVVHPSKEKYLEIVGRRPAIALRCASALATLFGVKADVDSGKF